VFIIVPDTQKFNSLAFGKPEPKAKGADAEKPQ